MPVNQIRMDLSRKLYSANTQSENYGSKSNFNIVPFKKLNADTVQLSFKGSVPKETVKKYEKTGTGFDLKVFEGENPDVKKYVFTKDGEGKAKAVAEAVVYKYGKYLDRTVICCSVQSGCPVGCDFCGTGKKFIRNLKQEEIVDQIQTVLKNEGIEGQTDDIKKFQIMFMSMGEPMLNWNEVKPTIKQLSGQYPNAQLLLSSVGIKNDVVLQDIIKTSREVPQVGLQFSIHRALDDARNAIIPYKNKLSLQELRDYGIAWFAGTERRPFINYCITDKSSSPGEIERLKLLFPKSVFNFTFSTLCNPNKTSKADETDYNSLKKVYESFIEEGYNVRVFNPAGKDDIGGGCGQLWYVQDWLKKLKRGATETAESALKVIK